MAGSSCLLLCCLFLILAAGFSAASQSGETWKMKTSGNKRPGFSFASYYGDHMVLQQSPKRSTVWGTGAVGHTVTLTIIGQGIKKTYSTTVKLGFYPTVLTPSGVWSVMLDAMPAGGPYSILVEDETQYQAIFLKNIMFGDVWLCSGQSNMQFQMKQIMNATAEIASADKFPDIRVLFVALTFDTKPRTDLISIAEGWSVSSHKTVTGFSALCWLFGRHLYQTKGYPVGLVASVWGGTPVEAWSAPEVLTSCGLPAQNGPDWDELMNKMSPLKQKRLKMEQREFGLNQYNNSVLYNAMIHPLLNMTIYGAIWYQGEANFVYGVDKYNCTFPGMIQDWRRKFHIGTQGQTDKDFPFGFVQLDGDFHQPEGSIPVGFPEIRWHQTADFGFVPNPKMNKVFMAVAVDLPDFGSPYWPVHSRYKQPVAARLWNSALAVAYNTKHVIYQGPIPTGLTVSSKDHIAELEFDNGKTTLEVRATDGFELCCPDQRENYCHAASNHNWFNAPILNSTGAIIRLSTPICPSGHFAAIRYEWKESPCQFLKCAIYSKESKLPASPFVQSPSTIKWKYIN